MRSLLLSVVASVLLGAGAMAQIPVEVFGGNKKATLDVLFFRFIKKKNNASTKWLFFNRNRASIDYKMTPASNLPQYGFTEALSYNHPKLKGFAPVAVVQLVNRGVFPKAGVQYAHTGKNTTVFTWLVAETLRNPNIDYFLLFRYTPKLTAKLTLFTQLELVNAFPTQQTNNFSFTQRIRVGLKTGVWQYGFGSDLSETGRTAFANTDNWGLFLRCEL
jgi:hypothetical protein